MDTETFAPGALERLRVDQVGSLLRPDRLKQPFMDFLAGQVSEHTLRHVQDETILQVLRAQDAHDVPVVTDGEFRRYMFMDSFTEVAGYPPLRPRPAEAPREGTQYAERPTVRANGDSSEPSGQRVLTERMRLIRNGPLDEFSFAQAHTTRPVKVTLINVDRIATAVNPSGTGSAYRDVDDVFGDVIRIQRQIVAELVAAGCQYIQIDAPAYTSYIDAPTLDRMRASGRDPRADLQRAIEADNAVISGFENVTFGIHLCKGNRQSMYHRSGTYDAIAEQLFAGLKHQRLLLEYDDERSGDFEPLRFVPENKVAVLGLVTTKRGDLESPDLLRRRLEEASRHLPLEQLALSPQCGFASILPGNLLTEDDQWRKFDLVRETARQVWG